LVHEAYIRLVGDEPQGWNSRGHFFAAAAEAMRRILVETARRKKRLKHGGDRERMDTLAIDFTADGSSPDILALDEAMEKLAKEDPGAAALVKLRYFSGLTVPQAAAALGISLRTAEREWAYARAWLYDEMTKSQ